MTVRLTRDEARRIAVRGQLLTAERPAGIVETIDALTIVNIEPTAAVAPSADLILWSRLGWPYQPADLVRLVEEDRAVFEWGGFYRAMTDLPLLLPEMRRRPAVGAGAGVARGQRRVPARGDGAPACRGAPASR